MAGSSTSEHNNWLMIGEALLISKTALEPYIQQIVNRWHQILLNRLEKKGQCKNRPYCNAKTFSSLCISCKSWYTEICKKHKGDKDKISWDNTNCTKWAQRGQGWEVAKVFMANLGPKASQVVCVQSTDIAGLLTVLQFFPDEAFGNPVLRPSEISIRGVRNHVRNLWAHSPRQVMTTSENKKAMSSLKNFFGDRALRGKLGNALNDLKELERNGIINISSSEINCLKLLGKELGGDVAKLKADMESLTTISNTQGDELQQLRNKIDDILSALDISNQKLDDNSFNMQQILSTFEKLKEEFCGLKNDLKLRVTNLETDHERFGTRQDRFEENQERFETKLDRFEENLGAVTTNVAERFSSLTLGASLQTRLPDFQNNVFGRDADIDRFVKLLVDDKKPCVVLFGAPGFGKTTVVINLAHKLKEQTNKVFVFISLREMRSIKDICREFLAQVGRYPKEQEMEELCHWTRSLKEEVVFILDNAEDALQGDVKDAFCDLLQKLRTNNSRCIQFIITSRERFSLSAMEVTCEEIKELNLEEGMKVICSMVSEGSKISGNSEALKELVHLCGGVPLALKIIGSLLNYVDHITSLLEELKSSPMETLEDTALPRYHQSISVAFECSFKRLNASLQSKLVRLSVFKGPFTQEVAAVILDCRNRPALVGKVLKELTDKSLVSKLDRYEMHSLIQKYLLDIKTKQYQNDFDNASDNFIDYYSLLVIKGRDLFWSKDNFKQSIQMFRDDNLNIEIALEMCYQDTKKMKKIFFPIVWSVCMYLEMCISLEKLNKFLESCSSAAETENEKGTEMEAQCFLAYYEYQKAERSEKYEKHFSNAKKLFDEKEHCLSQSQKWLYKHTYGFRLDQQRRSHEALKVTESAVEIAEKNPATTDLSLSLSLLSIIEKHRKNFYRAEWYLKKSHEERKKALGENHILTVPKHLADLYLQLGKYNEALNLYEGVLETYKYIDMNGEKQCIYLLKNMGCCYSKLEMFEKSSTLFKQGIDLAEKRLEGDHKVKVLLYSELAHSYYAMKNKPEARKNAHKALEMQMQWKGRKSLMTLLKRLDEDAD